MTSDRTFVIVGAGLAGAKAADTLREEGFDGRLVLVGAEVERPYERPPLSKEYLRGEVGREKVYVHDEGFYAEHDIELRLGRTAIVAFWLTGDRVVAGMNVNVWEVTDDIQRLIRERAPVDDRRLADPDVALEQLAPIEGGSSA